MLHIPQGQENDIIEYPALCTVHCVPYTVHCLFMVLVCIVSLLWLTLLTLPAPPIIEELKQSYEKGRIRESLEWDCIQ